MGVFFNESHGDFPESHGDFPESNGDFWTFNVFIAPRYEIPPGRPEMLPWSIFFSSKMGAVPMLTTRIFQDVPKENKKNKKKNFTQNLFPKWPSCCLKPGQDSWQKKNDGLSSLASWPLLQLIPTLSSHSETRRSHKDAATRCRVSVPHEKNPVHENVICKRGWVIISY